VFIRGIAFLSLPLASVYRYGLGAQGPSETGRSSRGPSFVAAHNAKGQTATRYGSHTPHARHGPKAPPQHLRGAKSSSGLQARGAPDDAAGCTSTNSTTSAFVPSGPGLENAAVDRSARRDREFVPPPLVYIAWEDAAGPPVAGGAARLARRTVGSTQGGWGLFVPSSTR
jgi:hypothetical protein